MGSRALVLVLKGVKSSPLTKRHRSFNCETSFRKLLLQNKNFVSFRRNCSSTSAMAATKGSSLEPPDVPLLAQTARISLSPHEVEEFAPKIRQVVDWFGQLQAVDLQRVEPAIRADTGSDNFRDDVPQAFEEREAIIAAVPNYEEPYIKVPKVLNKE